jgi:hypothetical protein
MDIFRITLASPPDRERLVADIFVDSTQIAELNREHESGLKLELYARPDGQPWSVDLQAFLTAVHDASAALQGR